ncbi:MAG: OmpA family protein [Pseudomonadota bacterium]
MRHSSPFLSASVLVFAASVAAYIAMLAADMIEARSVDAAQDELDLAGLSWVELAGDGLTLTLSGTAPDEPARFRALTTAATVVDPSRLVDAIWVERPKDLVAPDFQIEILRGEDGISLIGLIPAGFDRDEIYQRAGAIQNAGPVTDLLETADYPPSPSFSEAVDFALTALADLPKSKISASAQRVSITALAQSEQERQSLRRTLAEQASDSFILALDISAPRPIVAPYTLRFVKDVTGPHFDACTADTDAARDEIVKAAIAAGLKGRADCVLGLGVPSPRWAEAVVAGIGALADMTEGNLTFSDADVSLITPATTSQGVFDRAVGELEAALPPVFSLNAKRLPPESSEVATDPEFLATLSPEGLVQLRGLVADPLMRGTVSGLAQARFGVDQVYQATRTASGLPQGWSVRVLTGLEVLAILDQGSVVVAPEQITVSGLTGNKSASSEIARLLSERLGTGDYDISVNYIASLDPLAGLPTADECVERLNQVQADTKITFDPGEATIRADALGLIDLLAEGLEDCDAVKIEVAGHTDSQGRESMNLALSQARAEAVIDALLARRVRVGNMVGKGYGETEPIADNSTESGREANRRIEFRLQSETAVPSSEEDEPANADGESTTSEDTEEPSEQN